jgi:probable phosphomutase (TIGR03848 family)
MPTILLIRHGENDYVKTGRLAGRLPGVHLNEKGRQQAEAVAEALCKMLPPERVKAVFSSPLERTMETAGPIARAFNLEIIPREGLIETQYGEWQDKKVKGLSRLKIWKNVQSAPSLFTFPGGESFADTQTRICQEIYTLIRDYEQKDILVCVSHADPIKLAVAYFLGLPIDLFQRLHVAPASINVLYIDQGVSRLLALNYELSFSLGK